MNKTKIYSNDIVYIKNADYEYELGWNDLMTHMVGKFYIVKFVKHGVPHDDVLLDGYWFPSYILLKLDKVK